jgi:DNA (cytosine-5)-methyltransferase 1
MTPSAYYNENDKYAAAWIRNLMAAGHIMQGEVDERSIVDVRPEDLRGFTRCHFFAGIAGWDYALALAGWPREREVFTGSCPCQPFSSSGKQRGGEDARHLWPAFFRIIRERRPTAVFGEQVAGASGLAWLDHVCAGLEGEGYTAAAADLPACSVGADHTRQRLYWVAHADSQGWPQLLRDELRVRDQAQTEWAAIALDTRSAHEIRNGRQRVGEPPFFVSSDGLPPTVGRLRAYGNAIVPQVTAVFIEAVMECAP